jgi:hypothetical protein
MWYIDLPFLIIKFTSRFILIIYLGKFTMSNVFSVVLFLIGLSKDTLCISFSVLLCLISHKKGLCMCVALGIMEKIKDKIIF